MSKCLRRGHGGLIPLCFEEAARTDTYGGRRTMANGKLLRQLIRSGAEGDLGSFRGAARRVIEEERQKQHLLIDEALKSERMAEIMDKYGKMVDVFILCVDRDGKVGRRRRLDQIESEFGGARVFLAENAWEEIETWALAGLRLPGAWRWAEVRAEIQVKERYFEPLALQRGFTAAIRVSLPPP